MKLGVNIDHVATLRQARKEKFPEPWRAAIEAKRGGADSITMHLREDRRHIQDHDLWEVKKKCRLPLNLEMALAPEIIGIALDLGPEKVCIVPERRQEVTTEGGLDAVKNFKTLCRVIPRLRAKGIQVSLFIDASIDQVCASAKAGADAIEIHTGAYARVRGKQREHELAKIRKASGVAAELELHVHAGHGIDYENAGPLCRIPEIEELNIGFSIVSRAVFTGFRQAVLEMKKKLS